MTGILGLPEGWFISRIQIYHPDMMLEDQVIYIRIQTETQAFDYRGDVDHFDWDKFLTEIRKKINDR